MSVGPHVDPAPGVAADPAGQTRPAAVGAAPSAAPPAPAGGGRHTARWIALGLAIPMLLLFAVLATTEPAGTRVVPSPLVGRAAPPIEGVAVVGEQTSLSELRGRFVVVNFFATWCEPCRDEHDDLVRFAADHARRGDASVVSVVYDDERGDIERFFAEHGGSWPVIDDPDAKVDWGVRGVPESFVIAPDGTVLARIVGGVRAERLDALIAGAADSLVGGGAGWEQP